MLTAPFGVTLRLRWNNSRHGTTPPSFIAVGTIKAAWCHSWAQRWPPLTHGVSRQQSRQFADRCSAWWDRLGAVCVSQNHIYMCVSGDISISSPRCCLGGQRYGSHRPLIDLLFCWDTHAHTHTHSSSWILISHSSSPGGSDGWLLSGWGRCRWRVLGWAGIGGDSSVFHWLGGCRRRWDGELESVGMIWKQTGRHIWRSRGRRCCAESRMMTSPIRSC